MSSPRSQGRVSRRKTIGVVCLLGWLVSIPSQAHAYIDPGSVSMILQGLIAGFLGAVFVLKMYWRRGLDVVRRLFARGEDD